MSSLVGFVCIGVTPFIPYRRTSKPVMLLDMVSSFMSSLVSFVCIGVTPIGLYRRRCNLCMLLSEG